MKYRLFIGSIFIIILAVLLSFKLNTAPSSKSTPAEGIARAFNFVYSTSINHFPDQYHEMEIWVPLPQSDFYQDISRLQIDANVAYSIETYPEYGNKILYARVAKNRKAPIRIRVKFTVLRNQFSVWHASRKNFFASDEKFLHRFLQPDSLVPIDGEIARAARKVVSPEMSDLQKARAIYDYVVHTMKYDKSGQGWGRGDAVYACDVQKGNCTDFHSLFIGMARAVGIPARFIIGFPVPDRATEGQIPGYHCWAEFYTREYGWVPIDASEAFKHPDKREFLFGGLDPNRVAFTMGRDIPMVPTHKHRKFNYLIYPYIMVDGREFTNVQYEFHYQDIRLVKDN